MARADGFKNRFNSGELSDEAWANSDLQQHANGCAQALNFMPRVQGPLQRRYGFWFAGLSLNQSTATRPIPFRRSVDDAFMIELADGVARVRDSLGGPVMDGGSPVEFASPFAAADLAGLRWKQTGDVIVFFHADGRQPQRLLRNSNTDWNFAPYEFVNGPWRAENADTGIRLSATGIEGVVTLNATAALFEPGMVGTTFRVRASTGSPSMRAWMADWDPVDNELVISNGRVYRATNGTSTTKTGNNPPIHDRGTADDGKINWDYVHDGAGILRVDAYVNSTQVTCTVLATLPTTGDASHNLPSYSVAFPETDVWAEAAYSDYRGWPTAWPAIREERLLVGGGRSEPDKFDATRTAGFDTSKADFTPGLGTGRVVDDDAVRRFCGDESAKVAWLASATLLLAGTHAGENAIAGQTLDNPLTAEGTSVRGLSEYGVAEVAPEKAHEALLYVARGGETLRELIVGGDLSQAGGDLSFFAEHIASRGFAELAWTGEPDNLLWARLDDGGLATFLYQREQKAFGWASQQLGGGFTVEYIAKLPGAYARTALWVHAVRTKNGAPQRVILVLSARRETLRLDVSERYFGTPVAGVDGLDHLEGERITLMAGPGDGTFAQYDNVLVTGGEALLPDGRLAAEIIGGLAYLSRFESLPGDLMGPGTTLAKRQRVTKMSVIWKGVDARMGTITDGEAPSPLERVGLRRTSESASLAPKRQNDRISCSAGASRDPRLVVECDGGFDLTLQAMIPTELANG